MCITRLRTLPAQLRQLVLDKALRVQNLSASIHDPSSRRRGRLRRGPAAGPAGKRLQIVVLLQRASADHEDDGLAEALAALPEARLDTAGGGGRALRLRLGAGGGGHGAAGVGGARVEVQVVLGAGDGRGRGVLRVHHRLHDLRERQVLVRRQEVLHARDQVVQVRADARFLEAGRQPA